jgi:hypothetical protein
MNNLLVLEVDGRNFEPEFFVVNPFTTIDDDNSDVLTIIILATIVNEISDESLGL